MLILLAGDYMTGKTVTACTFPKPLIYLDMDDNFQSVEKTRDKAGNLVVSVEEQKEITRVSLIKTGVYPVSLLTIQGGKVAPRHTAEAPQIVDKINTILSDLGAKKGVDGDGKTYRTLVLDSTTAMFLLWKEAIMSMNKQSQVQIPDYGTLEMALFSQLIPNLKALPLDYIILVSHTETDKDENSGRIVEFPVGPSRAQGQKLGKLFTEVWRQEIMGDRYVIRTNKAGGLMQVGSRSGVPDMTDSHYDKLKQWI